MWQQKSPVENKPLTANIFKPILRRYHLKSNMIRITFDPRYADRIGIQAISNNLFVYSYLSFLSNRIDWFNRI